jgi:hypothetical protein
VLRAAAELAAARERKVLPKVVESVTINAPGVETTTLRSKPAASSSGRRVVETCQWKRAVALCGAVFFLRTGDGHGGRLGAEE